MTPQDLAAGAAVGLSLSAVLYVVLRLSRRVLQRVTTRMTLPAAERPFSPAWLPSLERLVPGFRRLDETERHRLGALVDVFLRQVPIEGCAGLELTDEMRVVIAAGASMLVLNLPFPRFTSLRRVLLYPDTYIPERIVSPYRQDVLSEPGPTAGEAWRDGIVVLSWANILRDAAAESGSVILHEFAHVLDGEDGHFNGVPLLEPPQTHAAWELVFAPAFAELQEVVVTEGEPALRPYAATNRAEFFAVATETFFVAPAALRDRLPLIYDQLRQYFHRDP